ncbi:MAG: hypothetical protein WD021_02480 [Rhodothermales bacterium]
MLTTVANSLFDRLIDAFPPNRPYGRVEIRRDPMPEPVRAYLAHLLDVKLRELLEDDLPSGAWVDAYAAEVKSARTAYVEALSNHQAVPALEWADVLRSATHETLRYLVRPADTLLDTVFDRERRPVRSEIVLERIGYFAPYPYFGNVVEAYFQQKDETRIDRERFEGLVTRTDRQMTSDFSPHQWRRLLDPLVDVLRAAGRRDVPLELLKIFLEEKEADGPIRRMKRLYGLDGFVPFDALEEIFVKESEPTGGRTKRADRHASDERPASKSRGGAVPLWKQFEHGYEPEVDEPQREPAEAVSDSAEQPLWKQFRKAPQAPPPSDGAKLTDLERTVLGERGAKNRDLFVQHLFSGKEKDYESTLRRLAHAGSWSQASQIIAQDVFLKHQVNIYSDPAVTFTDAAEAQYRS